MMMMMMMEY